MQTEKPEYVEFAVTARKYKTLLTKKYKDRKVWLNPSPYDIQSIIPGTVLEIFVKEGEIVQEGAPILTLEAMKMINRIEMPFTARIRKINVEVGIQIPKDTLMIELEPLEDE
jgi:biotin carboxyl carrier protein